MLHLFHLQSAANAVQAWQGLLAQDLAGWLCPVLALLRPACLAPSGLPITESAPAEDFSCGFECVLAKLSLPLLFCTCVIYFHVRLYHCHCGNEASPGKRQHRCAGENCLQAYSWSKVSHEVTVSCLGLRNALPKQFLGPMSTLDSACDCTIAEQSFEVGLSARFQHGFC